MRRLRSLGMGVRKQTDGVKRKQTDGGRGEQTDGGRGEQLVGAMSASRWLTSDTLSFLCAWCAQKSGQKHLMLQVTQIELLEPSDASPYLIYTEN